MERTAEGDLIIMPPAGGSSGRGNARLTSLFESWASREGTGLVFDSSTGFKLPNGTTRSTDVAWVRNERLDQRSDEEWEKLSIHWKRTVFSFGLAFSLAGVSAFSGVQTVPPPPVTPGNPIPSWLAKAPSLPPPEGAVIRVKNAADLLAAADHVEPGGTILVEDGHYVLPRVLVFDGKSRIFLRGASGDPLKATLSGQGWDRQSKGGDILHIAHCDGVTIADLTFADSRSYGIKVEAEHGPRDIRIHNCRFRDIGVRAIKGSAGQDPNLRAVNGSVRYCSFENTKIPPADWLYGGDYVAAIDMMALEDWTFSDNYFRNIKGRNGGGRAAIFIWVRSRRVVIERNVIVDCDRGVALGNPGQSTANAGGKEPPYVAEGVIRNNFIAGGADCGIELWHCDHIQVYHNTIWRPERNWNRGIRVGTGTARTDIVNNLVHGEIRLEGGEAELRSNLTGKLTGFFVDAPSGNLALTAAATAAMDKALSLPEAVDDIRRHPRSGKPDIGAWEFERDGQ